MQPGGLSLGPPGRLIGQDPIGQAPIGQERRKQLLRRSFLLGSSTALLSTLAPYTRAAGDEHFEIVRSEDEWRAELTPDEFRVLRKEGTEEPFTSRLLEEDREGFYSCAGCGLPLFSSQTKFHSGTGWPSSYKPLRDAVRTREDRSLVFIVRTEVHCRRCGGHIGHVFDDGPPPTGKRYCMNGIAMDFVPKLSAG